MGAPAISTRARPAPRSRPARPAAKPSPAKPRQAPRAKAARAPARTQSRPSTRAGATRMSRAPLPAGPAGVVRLPAVAVGRTAGALSGLADCGFVIGMTRSRVWIVVLGILLGGIVALNVWGLSLSAASSDTAERIGSLQRENGVLRARVANRLSNDRIEREAAKLGLATPAPDAVEYLKSGDGDAAKAAERIAAGKISVSPPATASEPAAVDPATGLPLDPAAVDPATAVDPVATVDPASGLPVDPATGLPAAPATTDPSLAAPLDPAAG